MKVGVKKQPPPTSPNQYSPKLLYTAYLSPISLFNFNIICRPVTDSSTEHQSIQNKNQGWFWLHVSWSLHPLPETFYYVNYINDRKFIFVLFLFLKACLSNPVIQLSPPIPFLYEPSCFFFTPKWVWERGKKNRA